MFVLTTDTKQPLNNKTMKVDAEEIVFIKKNAPKAFPRLIIESLTAKGFDNLNRTTIHTEISTLKDNYNSLIIEEARRLLLSVKGVKYSNKVTKK